MSVCVCLGEYVCLCVRVQASGRERGRMRGRTGKEEGKRGVRGEEHIHAKERAGNAQPSPEVAEKCARERVWPDRPR